jgi:hypothetical protein
MFFPGIFFEGFAEKSSSFFTVLSLIPAGFSSQRLARLFDSGSLDLGTDEKPETPAQMPALPAAFSS